MSSTRENHGNERQYTKEVGVVSGNTFPRVMALLTTVSLHLYGFLDTNMAEETTKLIFSQSSGQFSFIEAIL